MQTRDLLIIIYLDFPMHLTTYLKHINIVKKSVKIMRNI